MIKDAATVYFIFIEFCLDFFFDVLNILQFLLVLKSWDINHIKMVNQYLLVNQMLSILVALKPFLNDDQIGQFTLNGLNHRFFKNLECLVLSSNYNKNKIMIFNNFNVVIFFNTTYLSLQMCRKSLQWLLYSRVTILLLCTILFARYFTSTKSKSS